MAKRFNFRRLFLLMSAAGLIGSSDVAMAAAFQLWEQDAASIGNYHAGIAATADDASTSFYNPAGLVRIKNQQFVVGADPVVTSFLYRGSVQVNTIAVADPQTVTAQGGGFNLVPFGHYAAPLSDSVVFGMSVVVPFGLKTDWGDETPVRYAALLSSLKVVDFTPSLGIAITDKFSVGFGFDFENLRGEFNQTATASAFVNDFDTVSNNSGSDTAYGYHLGALYQFSPQTRVGLAFHSQVVHHLKGTSTFDGALANDGNGGSQSTDQLNANVTLPAVTSLSLFHSVNPTWDVMGSISYIKWNVLQNLVLNNTAGILNGESTNTLPIVIRENYHNTFNYSVGANYHVNEKFMVRTGVGYDQSPSCDRYRNLQLPDSDRIAVGLGAHYQATKTIGFDVGWTHVFGMNTRINNLSQTVGDETVVTNGSVQSNADVYGLQMKWDIL